MKFKSALILIFTLIFSMSCWAKDISKQVDGTIFTKPRPIKTFNLVNDNGQKFTNENLKGHWSALFFGFTHCQYICPTTMAELNKTYKILEADGQAKNFKVVMISVDPTRDTAATMHKYVKSFNKNFIGVTGSEKEIKALSRAMGILALKTPNKTNPKDYEIDHSGTVLLVNPQGDLYGIFSMPHSAKNLAKDFTVISSNA